MASRGYNEGKSSPPIAPLCGECAISFDFLTKTWREMIKIRHGQKARFPNLPKLCFFQKQSRFQEKCHIKKIFFYIKRFSTAAWKISRQILK